MTVEQIRAEIEARPADSATGRRFERARREVIFDEIVASCALAGAHLTPAATRRLLEREATVAGDLGEHLLVLGYARAAVGIAREPAVHGTIRRLITVAEIQRLHQTIVSPLHAVRTPPAPPGAWRRANLPPLREGMVTVPHWLIEFEMASLADRIGGGPPDGMFEWLAGAYERLERIRPFVNGNGRVARLVVNLLLARCGYPPATIAPSLVPAYRRALGSADAGDPKPLAELFERGVRANLEHLATALLDDASLQPLAKLAGSRAGLDALRKAAQRGKLRTVTRGHQTLSTPAWVDAYLSTKSRAGRPRLTGSQQV